MAVLLNTSLGDIVIDLHTDLCPLTTKNFLKLCKIKYYNNCLFHTVQKDFIVQTGDPTGTGSGGDSIYKFLYGEQARFFDDEIHSKNKHDKVGTVAMASAGENLNASQFYITTRADLDYLDGKHTVFGEVAEGLDTLIRINEAYVDESGRPYKNIRIKHTYVLDDPFDDPVQLSDLIPEKSPELKPPAEGEEVRLEDDWIPMDEQLDQEELEKSLRRKEAQSRAVVLEMVGDIPEAEIKPPENVLFVCKLNPVTQEDDLEIIFSRFGNIISADIIRDYKTGDSLCYGFIEFETQEACEAAYFKMDNVLIDDRRIHVDFSQSVAKLWTRYRRFGNKDTGGGEGGDFAPKSKGRGCFKCGEAGHFAKDCPNQGVNATLQAEEKPKYLLKDTGGQHGGTNKRYEMVFEDDTVDGADKSLTKRTKEKQEVRKHDYGSGSSQEESTDGRGRMLPSKRPREDTQRSKEHQTAGYGTKESRKDCHGVDEKGKGTDREERHTHGGKRYSRYGQFNEEDLDDERHDRRKNEERRDRHRQHERDDRHGTGLMSGMQKRHREDEPEDRSLQRGREGRSASRDHYWHAEYKHDRSREEEREERSKPRSRESRHALDHHHRDVEEEKCREDRKERKTEQGKREDTLHKGIKNEGDVKYRDNERDKRDRTRPREVKDHGEGGKYDKM